MPAINNKNVSSIDGHIGDVTFSLTGPYDLISAIVKFIRNLNRMTKGGYF